MSDWILENNCIHFKDMGKKVCFQYGIRQAVNVSGTIILILDVPGDVSMTENAFAFDANGTQLWQIEKHPCNSTDPSNMYTCIMPKDDETVDLGNWNGVLSTVDLKTGLIRATKVTKIF